MVEKYNLVAEFVGSINNKWYSEDLECYLDKWSKPKHISYQKDVSGMELSSRWNMGIFDFDKDWNVIFKVVDYISTLPNRLLNDYFWNGDIQKDDFRIFRYSDISVLFEHVYNFVLWFNENKNRYGIA